MDKGDYINYLFDNIKDCVKFDGDVEALNALMVSLLDIDIGNSFQKWSYILEKYNIKKLRRDIDFVPILRIYPLRLLEKVGFKRFLDYIMSLKEEKRLLIYNYLFNTFDDEAVLYKFVDYLIMKRKGRQEKEMVGLLVKTAGNYPIDIFDMVEFLRKVIKKHLAKGYKDIKLLKYFTNIPDNLKDKSILMALLVDYI